MAMMKRPVKKATPSQIKAAKEAGRVAGEKKFKADKKAGLMPSENKPSPSFLAQKKAERKMYDSFKKSAKSKKK
jgi:hypothetical protein